MGLTKGTEASCVVKNKDDRSMTGYKTLSTYWEKLKKRHTDWVHGQDYEFLSSMREIRASI